MALTIGSNKPRKAAATASDPEISFCRAGGDPSRSGSADWREREGTEFVWMLSGCGDNADGEVAGAAEDIHAGRIF